MLVVQRIILAALFFGTFSPSGLASAAEVLRVGSSQRIIAVSHETNRHWLMNATLCVLQDGREIACGNVVKVTAKGAVVKLDRTNNDIMRGDLVKAAAPGRKPATALLDSVAHDDNVKAFHNNFSAGISAGTTFFFPLLQYQRSISPKFALGIMPLFIRSSTADASVSAFGGLATLNYYGNEFFRGLWVQAGAGIYSFSVSSVDGNESGVTPAGLLTVGWRGYWDLGFNIGVGAGVQYVKDPNFQTIDIQASGIHPLVTLDIGINF